MTPMIWNELSGGVAVIPQLVMAMAVVAAVEVAVPLHARGRWHRLHLWPNLALTFITFATNVIFNAAVLTGLVWLEANGYGLLRALGLPSLVSGVVGVVLLDLSFYVAHVTMHMSPACWRYHRVHHADPAVDVTTTVRQHPGEGVIRYAFMGTFAFTLGPSLAAFMTYRVWSVLNGLLEHANIRVPRRLDTALSAVLVTPNMHKLHHSRARHQTNSNYGNLFSVFDRVLRTFLPTALGESVVYGLAGYDDLETQSLRGLLALPFQRDAPRT